MKHSFLFILMLLCAAYSYGQDDTTQIVVEGRRNSLAQEKKPYVIMISADGFRYDYAKKFNAVHLQQLAGSGIKADAMFPSFPSVTFPNHYTMVTGLYPSHHGLVNNGFYDRKLNAFYSYHGKTVNEPQWYGGTPLWVLAEQQHMLTASFYWVGSEAPIKGCYPTYRFKYNEKINIHNRIQVVTDWLRLPAERRPHLITFYFPEVDHAGHKYGPNAEETRRQVLFIDSAVNELNKAVKKTGLKVSYVFVSDHGMTSVDTENPINMPAAIDTNKFIISGDGILVELYAHHKSDIQSTYNNLRTEAKDYKVYLRSEVPAYLHYGAADDWHDRIGDILLIPDYPKVFQLNAKHKINLGWHGYDPHAVRDMMATFYAWGPAFKSHKQIKPFENVNIYPIVTQILGLKYTERIDGKNILAKQVLAK